MLRAVGPLCSGGPYVVQVGNCDNGLACVQCWLAWLAIR
jgi:hypothetical protein